ncbi:MAG: hypothetical protein ACM33T_16985 [Solirubrobacterales bacterium]
MTKRPTMPNTPENDALNRRILIGFVVIVGGLLGLMIYGALT